MKQCYRNKRQTIRSLAVIFTAVIQTSALKSAESVFDRIAAKHIAQEDSQVITLVTGGKQTDLRKDPIAIAAWFGQRPSDPLLTQQMKSFLTKPWADRGLELRQGMLTLPLFKATPFPANPTWAENPFRDDYWVFNLHSLLLARYLIAAHQATGDPWFLATLESLTRDWIADNTRDVRPSPFSWNDHATAMRLENLLYTLEYTRTRGVKPEFIRDLLLSIHLHCAVLADDSFYVKNTNHGLDQSYRLYWAAAAIPEFPEAATWRELGRKRTVDELSFALSEEGVHVENSPAYHYRHLGVMAQISEIFSGYDRKSLLSLMGERLSGALRFGAYIIKPDDLQPLLGDTQGTEALGWKTWLNSYADIDTFPELLYSVTAGARGRQPAQPDMVFKKSAYAIFRDRWRKGSEFNQTVYLALKAGFLSTNHRHQDDLSILLYGYGEDWLIDSGLYRYQEDDPIRRHVESAPAHNLAIVDDVMPLGSVEGRTKTRIDSYITGETRASVGASHELFPGYRTARKVDYFKPSRIEVEDQILPSDGRVHTYRILFHVPADKRVEPGSNSVTICSQRSPKMLRLCPIRGAFSRIYLESGMREPHYQGWVSAAYDQVEPSTCIVFETRGPALKSLIELQFLDAPTLTADGNRTPSLTLRDDSAAEGKRATTNLIGNARGAHPSGSGGSRSQHYALVTIDVECRKGDPPVLQRRAIFGELGGRQYGLPLIYDELARYHAKGIFFVDYSMFYFAEPLLAETLASIRSHGHDVAMHLHWNQVPRELQPQRAVVLREAVKYFARINGERPKAYRGGSYQIDDAIAAALRDEGVLMDFSFFLQNPENCSFYKRDLGNAFARYEGLYAVPVTTMPGYPTRKLDVNWRPIGELLNGVDTVPVPVLFLHSFSFLTPWNEGEGKDIIESVSGELYRQKDDPRLSNVDEEARRSFEAVLEHWQQRGVHTLGLAEIDAMQDKLVQITNRR